MLILIKAIKQFHIQMSLDQKQGFLRIVLMGLPYSGKKEVAKILSEKYGCKLISTELSESQLQDKLPYKVIAEKCFEKYQQRKVVVMQNGDQKLLQRLRKRNYSNIIFVESIFKKRFQNFSQRKENVTVEDYQTFCELDQQYQNQQYYKCLQYARVRILNNGSIEDLIKTIQNQKQQIIRPFRPEWDQYFMKIADIAKRRSNCMKSSVGAVIVNDSHRVVSTGYNGTPQGLKSCFRSGCERCNSNAKSGLDECRCLHAEQSAIMEAGIYRAAGCKLYTTLYPCFSCAKVIKQAGIKEIYYMEEYNKKDSGVKFLSANFKEENIKKITISNMYY